MRLSVFLVCCAGVHVYVQLLQAMNMQWNMQNIHKRESISCYFFFFSHNVFELCSVFVAFSFSILFVAHTGECNANSDIGYFVMCTIVQKANKMCIIVKTML